MRGRIIIIGGMGAEPEYFDATGYLFILTIVIGILSIIAEIALRIWGYEKITLVCIFRIAFSFATCLIALLGIIINFSIGHLIYAIIWCICTIYFIYEAKKADIF